MYVWGSGNGGRWSGMCEGCSLRSPVCNILILGGGALCAAGKKTRQNMLFNKCI